MPTTKPDRLKEAHERLTQAVESIVSGDDWQRMLKVASKFHNYSFNNQLLIFLQRPDATYVAGFRRWRSLDRTVRKGEKGIQIFAPCRYKTALPADARTTSADSGSDSRSSASALAVKVSGSEASRTADRKKVEDDNGDEQTLQQVRGFRVVHVFDISQTMGEPLADLEAVKPKLLDGAAPEGIWDALVGQANGAGFEVIRDRRGSENGFCDFVAKQIAVRPDVSPAQALKTLIHELGHALLHADNPPKTAAIAEVEVESVAFIVCDTLGLDSSSYSFSYVTRWASGDLDLVKATAERAITCAKEILGPLAASNSDNVSVIISGS